MRRRTKQRNTGERDKSRRGNHQGPPVSPSRRDLCFGDSNVSIPSVPQPKNIGDLTGRVKGRILRAGGMNRGLSAPRPKVKVWGRSTAVTVIGQKRGTVDPVPKGGWTAPVRRKTLNLTRSGGQLTVPLITQVFGERNSQPGAESKVGSTRKAGGLGKSDITNRRSSRVLAKTSWG